MKKIITKKAQSENEYDDEYHYEPKRKDIRFRGSIYVDMFIPDMGQGVEDARRIAEEKLREFAENIPNSYVGGVAAFQGHTLDREI